MKIKDYALIVIIFVGILGLFKLKNHGLLSKIFPTSVQSVLRDPIDSIKVIDSFRVNAFSRSYRLQFDFPKRAKYYSTGDTSITIFDTSGIKVRSVELKNIDEPQHSTLLNIIQRKK